ncbi:beta strand repeat-containing protein [Granulicella arctica]|uniref:Choice-of-anchor D domain-containing protein n=1 Tax=Granulicella arctica TaxID=940613 RepID=A0A7Y9TTT0_9BACT|nr:choice-of-anchor D domain-containing protein [Granulicella arctica]NYF80263.1 hypothetical protein [Granulicella arctica]
MMKKSYVRTSFVALILGLIAALSPVLSAQPTGPQQLSFAGLRSAAHEGQFNAVRVDTSGNLYLLLDQKDGVRLLKTDATATNVLAQAQFGAAGDVGLAMALDPSGNVYVTGTSTSGALTGTSGSVFPARTDTTVNAFVAKFDPSLNLDFVTFGGSSRTAPAAIAATADAVFITGLIYTAAGGSGLPVTPSAIVQAPAYGSAQNGFVETFSSNGSSLLYATYLSGQNGDTSPTAIVADTSDNAYIGGFTTTTGFPTVAALVPRIPDATSGFLIKLTPAGDGITFSTFIPGPGVSSLAIDPIANNLLLSGSIALGQFPVASVTTPLVNNTTYQVLLRMPLDGSAVLSSTLLAPGTQSFVTPSTAGTAWVDGTLSTPLLPLTSISNIGTGFAVRVAPNGTSGATIVDQTARFGGLAAANPNYASLPLTLTSLAVDSTGSPIVAGSVAPTASAALLTTQTFDLPLTNSPTTALPSAIHDAVLAPGSCNGSLCAGTAAYLAQITPTAAPSLALSTDASPNLILRNLGSTQATGIQITATGFATTTNCGSALAVGDECAILLTGTGPGSLTVQSANATTQTAALPAIASTSTVNPLVVSPKELDFGIQSSTSPILTRTINITNLAALPQTFISALNGSVGVTPFTFAQQSTNCAASGTSNTFQLAAGATCQMVLGFTASSDSTKDGPAQANWSIGSGNVLLTGFAQAAALSLSATTIDFGTQFFNGLASARYLYLSNNSTTPITHTPVALPSSSAFTITDRCPSELPPQTVCQIQFGYAASDSTSTDSVTLSLDQGLSVLVTGKTIPQPGTTGTTSNPSLTVSPTAVSFTNAVVVTGISSNTETVTVQNTGASAFTLSLSLTGDFTDQTDCTASLSAGSSCSVVLTFAPSQPGARQGLLSITAGSGTTPSYVNITGAGTAILPSNNGTLNFGDVPIGQPTVQWYKVSQPFTTLTAAASSPAFEVLLVEDIGYGHGQPSSSSFLGATTGSCLNCWLGVQFTPTATGPQTAALTLASSLAGNPYLLTLTGNGLTTSNLILTPISQDFGSIAVNSSSAPMLFTLTNSTVGDITVTAPVFTDDFSLSTAASGGASCSGSLAQNASCLVEVLFAPTTAGQHTGTLTLQTSAGSVSVPLTGFGSSDPGIAFNPSALIFNNVSGITATQQSITVSNTGNVTLQIGTPANANTAFQSTTTCASLSPGATCALTVTYTPATATVTDTLQLPVTATVGGSPVLTTYTIPLSATYTSESAGIQIVPGNLDYGPSSVNAIGGTRQYTINNLTAKSLTLNLTLPRQFVLSGAACAGLAPNANCTFSVSFLPLTNGSITGTLFAQATPTDGSATLDGLGYVQGYGTGTNSLTITGNLSPGRLLDFGQVPSGQSIQQILTLTNTSSASVSTTDSTVTVRRITSQWPFLSTTTCGTTLAIGQSCTVTVTYTPLNQVATGTASPPSTTDSGALIVESDAVSGPDAINLTGTSSATAVSAPSNAAPLVSFVASQNSLTFDTTAIGFSSAPQTVTLANTGNTVLHIASLTGSTDFSVAGSCPVLVPGASCLLTITFTPQLSSQSNQSVSTRIGTVEISSDSGTSLDFLSLIGTASPSTLVFQPDSLNFGTQLVGSTATLPIQITNDGTAAAVFNGITTTGDYAATGNCPATGSSLAPNATCTIQVGFTPTATGVRAGSLSVSSSVSTSALIAQLTGVGVQSHLSINPTALSFGNVAVGASTSLSLTLANTGTAAITGISLKISGDYAVTGPCFFATLSAGASCSVTIAFAPAATGTRTGILTIASSDPTSPGTVALTGNGTSTSINSGSFTLTVGGAASATQSVDQTHPATYTLTVTPLNSFIGTVVLNCNAIVVAPNATCSIVPSSVALNGSAQTATVTLNTLTSAELNLPTPHRLSETTALCILAPAALFLWSIRKVLGTWPTSLFMALLCTALMLLASGCGSNSIDASLRITPSGTYQYTVTGSVTTGTPLTQTVTLNLTVNAPN